MLKSRNNSTCSKSKDILAEFTDFYKTLYTTSRPSEAEIAQFLSKYKFSKRLLEEHRSFMDAPITTEELTSVVKAQKNNKATGRDGLPSEFYKTFAEDVIPQMLETCNKVLTTGEIPKTWSEAHIIVFAKPGKDPN